MTSVVNNSGNSLQKRTKERKNQTNSKTNCVVNSTANESNNQTNHSSDKIKSDSKLQPTAEQIRIANLMNDKIDDNELKAKIEQIVELTGSSRDDAVVALHDCDNDTAKAIDMILEGESGADSQWRSTGKKKKPPKSAVPQTGDENSKTDSNRDLKTERDSKSNANKSEKVNNRSGGRGGGPPRLQRAALANKGQRKPRESNRTSGDKNEVEDQNNDIFSSSATQQFKSSDPSAPPRRGDRRGRGRGGSGRGSNRGAFSGSAGRGSRTFQNRVLQSNDGFPNSIDTWTNSTADQSSNKTMLSSDCNTMTVGNWSDIAANEDWSEEDWEPNHMETKVFTPSTKISEKEEIDVRESMSSKLNSSQQKQNLSQFMSKSSVDSSQPSMSSLLSANISRNPNVTNVAGQTLLQQIQQSSAGQTPTLNQYSLSYNKEATESIKSLVGLTSSATFNSTNSDLLSANEQDLDSLTNAQTSSLTNKSRLKHTRTSKIPESAVEMPSNDTIAALGVHFGTLEFGSESNQFSLGTDSSVFQDAVNHCVTKATKTESNSLNNSSMLSQNNDNTYRPSTTNINDSTNKVVSSSIIQNSVLGQSLNSDSLLDRNTKSSVGQFSQKVLDRNNKSDYSGQQSVNANDIGSTYKTTYSSDANYNSNNYSTAAATTGYPYSSNSQYGTQGVTNYSNNFSGTTGTIGNHSNTSNQKLRDIDSNAHKPYEVSNTMVTNTVGGLISNSTVTTNVLKNTLSATGKGVHSVPPGVAATPVLSTPYIVQNTGVPLYPMGIPYDLQFQTTREHNFGPYGAQDVKYGRGSEPDVIPVSSTQTSQTHNQTFVNTFPPGYGFYLAPGMNIMPAQGIYPTAGPIYPVAQPQNTGSAGSGFGKGNTSYGSHSYNSGYDSISGVAQTQDYVKQSYPQSVQQHSKGIGGSNAGDLTSNNTSIYGKTHSQINKSYDKQSFQTTAPAFNLNAGNQSGALSSSYGAQYVLPHSQAMLSMSSLQNDVSQTSGTGVGGQRTLSQPHKSSGTGGGPYMNPKYNWN